MFAKKKEDVVSSEYYDLFTTEIVKDINGNDVEIPRSIGQYSVTQLEQEKANYVNIIASIDEKINIIKAL